MNLPRFDRPAVTSLLWKTGALGLAVYVGQRLGLAGVAQDLGPILAPAAILATEAAKTYIGESGAESFQETLLNRKANDPHEQIRNHDIHEVAGVAIRTLIEVYAKEHPTEQQWLEQRLRENFKTNWEGFLPENTPGLSYLQGRFVSDLYANGPEAIYAQERLQDTQWVGLLLSLLVGEHWETLSDSALEDFPDFTLLAAYVAAHYAAAFTYLLRHNPKAGYGVMLFLQSDLLQRAGEIHDSIKALKNPQPELTRFENLRATNRRNSVYLFERRISPFHGYTETCKTLQAFLKGTGLRWARLTGRAGSGKSRVALELVRYAASAGWQTGFLRRDHAFHAWESWTPLVPTLIVVDYALHRKTHVGENEIGLGRLLELLQERLAEFEVPVRVLLVDRDREPHVWSRFFEGVSSVIHDDEHTDASLHLSPIAPEHRLAILHEELERLAFPVPRDLPTVLGRLETRLKEPARPLFLLFAARGIAEGGNKVGDEASWSAEGLVEVVLRLEKKHWYDAGIDGSHLNALVLATLLGSCKLSPLTTAQKLGAGLPRTSDDDQFLMLCALGDGYNDALGELTGIRPDLLGELLILQRLKGDFLLTGQLERPNRERNKQQVIEHTKALVALAWELNPVAVGEYLDRTIEDYLFDPVYATTVETLCQKPKNKRSIKHWNFHIVPHLIFEWASNSMLDKAKLLLSDASEGIRARIAYAGGLYNALVMAENAEGSIIFLDELRHLNNVNTGISRIHEAFAKGLFCVLSRVENLDFRRFYLAELRQTAKDKPKDSAIQIEFAKGICNTMFEVANITEATSYLAELRQLAKTEQNNNELQTSLAKGIFNISNRILDLDQREFYLTELRQLAKANLENSEVQIELAKDIVNILNKILDINKSNFYLDELRRLAKVNPENSDIQIQLAKGFFNIIFHIVPNSDERKPYLDELRQLAKARPENIEIQIILANGLTNTITKVTTVIEIMPYLDELRKLAKEYPDKSKLQTRLATGLYNSTVVATTVAKGTPYLIELRQLAQSNPDNSKIQTRLATVLFNVTAIANVIEATPYLVELSQLAKSNPENREIQAVFIKGLVNAAGKASNGIEANLFLDELRQLAKGKPEDDEIKIRLTNGLYNVTAIASVTEIAPYLDELRQLAKANPENSEIQTGLAMGLYNASNIFSDIDARRPYLNELRQLAKANPENSEIQTELAKGIFNITADASITEVTLYLDELRQLARSNPENSEILIQFVKGILSTTAGASITEATFYLDELRQLARSNPGNHEIQTRLAKGLTNITTKVTSMAEAMPYLDELRQLAKSNPENSEIQNRVFRAVTAVSLQVHTKEEWKSCIEELEELAQQLSQREDTFEEWMQFVLLVIANNDQRATGKIFSRWFQQQSSDG